MQILSTVSRLTHFSGPAGQLARWLTDRSSALLALENRHTVLIFQHMVATDALTTRVLRRGAPNNGTLELPKDFTVNGIAKVFDSASSSAQDNWRCIVRRRLARLRVYTYEIQLIPHPVDKLIDIEPHARGNRDRVGDLVQQVQLLNGNGVNLVQYVNARNVDTVALNDVNELFY